MDCENVAQIEVCLVEILVGGHCDDWGFVILDDTTTTHRRCSHEYYSLSRVRSRSLTGCGTTIPADSRSWDEADTIGVVGVSQRLFITRKEQTFLAIHELARMQLFGWLDGKGAARLC